MNLNQSRVLFFISLLTFIGCASTYHGPASSVSQLGPILLPQVQVDAIQILLPQTSEQKLGPIGGAESLKNLIHYPQIALNAGVGGKVSVKVYVNHAGRIDSSVVIHSDTELFNQPSLDGIQRTKYVPLGDSVAGGYSMIITISYLIINIEQISIDHRKWRSGPFTNLKIQNNGSCSYTKMTRGEKPESYTGSIKRRQYYLAATAIRNQILMIPGSYYEPKNDSSIIVTYTENGKTSVYAGRVDSYEYNYFWVFDAILDKLIKDIHWYDKPEE